MLDEAEDASKSVRKAAKKAADKALRAADKAEEVAEEAAEKAEDKQETLEDRLDDLRETQESFQPLFDAADRAEHDHELAAANLVTVDQWLNDAKEQRDAAAADHQSANGELQERLADETVAAKALGDAQDSAAESIHALHSAQDSLAVSESNLRAANETAARAAHESVLAQQRLGQAEQALADATDAASESGDEIDGLNPNSQPESDRAYALNFNHQDDGAFETVVGESELVAGQIHLVPESGGLAVAVLDDEALPERDATRVYTTVRADDFAGLYKNGFIVFDYQSPDDFKYAGAWAGADRWAIGEVVDGELVDVATVDEVIKEGPAYELQIWIEDSTLTFLVEGQQKLQHTFDDLIDDGSIGIASNNARSRFDQVAVMQLHTGAGDVGIEQADPDGTIQDAALNELF